MKSKPYFYEFLESSSTELAGVARELELSIYSSPRTMVTHARIFADALLQSVMKNEELTDLPFDSFKERLDKLATNGLLTTAVLEAFHTIRKNGNQAVHQTRSIRISEALITWEALYIVVKWYIEVYGPTDFEVPEYLDPSPSQEEKYDMAELEIRLLGLEELLKEAITRGLAREEVAAGTVGGEVTKTKQEEPGLTTIRTLNFEDESLDIPYFLRDAFLLPQRFNQSTTFLIRLSSEQQARIMSELPNDLKGLHKYVNRFNELNDKRFFDELKVFVKEEKVRRRILMERQGELFLFFKANYIIVTQGLNDIELTTENFHSIPSLIKQFKRFNIKTVGQLPKELVILGKYENVGVGTVEKLFEQLNQKQNNHQKLNA